jgi:hypothetical protein
MREQLELDGREERSGAEKAHSDFHDVRGIQGRFVHRIAPSEAIFLQLEAARTQ